MPAQLSDQFRCQLRSVTVHLSDQIAVQLSLRPSDQPTGSSLADYSQLGTTNTSPSSRAGTRAGGMLAWFRFWGLLSNLSLRGGTWVPGSRAGALEIVDHSSAEVLWLDGRGHDAEIGPKTLWVGRSGQLVRTLLLHRYSTN